MIFSNVDKIAKATPTKRTPGRLPRVPFSTHQLQALECAFQSMSYLSAEEAIRLANRLDLTDTRVKIWFQNRRARTRREQRELEMATTSDGVLTSPPRPLSTEDCSFSSTTDRAYGSPSKTPPMTSSDLMYYSIRPVKLHCLKPY